MARSKSAGNSSDAAAPAPTPQPPTAVADSAKTPARAKRKPIARPGEEVSDAVDQLKKDDFNPLAIPTEEDFAPTPAPEAKAEEEKPKAEVEKPETPARPKQNQRLVGIARHYGVTGIEEMSNDELLAEIKAAQLEEEISEKLTARQKAQREAAEKKPPPEEDEFGEVEIEEEGVKVRKKVTDELSPVAVALLKKQSEKIKQLQAETNERHQKLEAENAQRGFKAAMDKAFTGLGEQWHPVLGAGGVDELIASGNANAIHMRNTVIGLAQQNVAAGSRRSLDEEIAAAAQALLGQFVKPLEEKKKPEKAEDDPDLKKEQDRWNRGGVAIPTGRKPGKSSALGEVLSKIDSRNGDGPIDDGEGWKKEIGFPD